MTHADALVGRKSCNHNRNSSTIYVFLLSKLKYFARDQYSNESEYARVQKYLPGTYQLWDAWTTKSEDLARPSFGASDVDTGELCCRSTNSVLPWALFCHCCLMVASKYLFMYYRLSGDINSTQSQCSRVGEVAIDPFDVT